MTEQKKDINKYTKCFEEHIKPQADKILNQYYLGNLKQNDQPLDAFLTEARLLITAGTQTRCRTKQLRDTLVFDTDHKVVHKKCISKGSDLTFEKACDMA